MLYWCVCLCQLLSIHKRTHVYKDFGKHRNLLRPSGVRLVPATLTIRMFRGEDLPQMDPGYFEGVKKFLHVGTVQKELVDPYCTVNFAGHKGRTQVIWNEQDPEWNKQINLGVRVSGEFLSCQRSPSMLAWDMSGQQPLSRQ